MIKNIFIFLIFINILSISAFAVQNTKQEINIAKKLERAQEYKRALIIFSRLYEKGNRTYEVTGGITRCFYSLRRYKDLIIFLNLLIKENPNRYNLKIDLGRAYYMNDQKEEALLTWNGVIQSNPPDVMKYRLTASAMAQLHLFDEAIAVYLKAVQIFKKQEMMYRDIAILYRNQLNYKKAAEYYLKFYTHFKKRYNDLYTQIIYMTSDKDALAPVISEFEKYYMENHDKKAYELLGGLYLKNSNLNKAYDVYEDLYKQDKNINHFFKFAHEAELKGEYYYAMKAHQQVLKMHPPENIRLDIKLKLAKNYYHLEAIDDEKDYINKSLGLLEELANNKKYIILKIAAKEFRAGIYLNYYNDIDRAINEYNEILKIQKNKKTTERIQLKLAKAYFLKNNLDRALSIYNQVKSKQNAVFVLYNKANIFYYRGYFSKAKKLYDQALAKAGIKDSLSNNILGQIMMIDQFAQDSIILAKYSKAELLDKQRRKSEAAEKFYNLFTEKNSISFIAGLQSARVLKQIGKLEEAVKVLREFIQQYPQNDNSDEAYFLLGQCESALDRYPDALSAYKKILENFPSSFYLEKARENARMITQINKKESSE